MDLKQECEKTFYRELYHFEDESQQLLMDETTRKLYLRKEKQFYDLQVYHYLKEHVCPQLANVHDFWEEEGRLIVIEEYIEGGTLDAHLQKEGTLPEEEALQILKEICKGLSFLHRATPQIVHRDLKASNVMLTKDGAVKLIDYDAAKTVKEGAGKDTVLIGTEGNAAPEQYGFAQSDGRTDIYALGILMKRLFPDTSRYAHIIQKATQMDPANRYQTVEELLSDVDAAHHVHERMPGNNGTTATIPKEASSAGESRGRPQTSRKRIIIPLLCALLVIGIAAAVLLPRVLSPESGAPGDSTTDVSFAKPVDEAVISALENDTSTDVSRIPEMSDTMTRYNWKQEYNDPDELVTLNGHTLIHVANIEENTISIWWLEEETGWSTLFWRGSLRTEFEEGGKQVLISEKTEGLDGIYISVEPTKVFELKDNTLSYQIWRGNDIWEIRLIPVP